MSARGGPDAIRHHLSDALAMAYAAGTLSEAFSVVVASHLSLCAECRARVAAFEALGGVTLEAVDAVPMRADVGAVTLSRTPATDAARPQAPDGVLPVPIGAYVGGDIDAIAWRGIGGGVRQMRLDTAGAGTARLIYIPPGQAVPDHGHRGLEVTMVISGAYRDEVDRFAAGDVEIAGEDVEHRPVAEPGAPCICIAATDARLRFRGLVPGIVGSVFGF